MERKAGRIAQERIERAVAAAKVRDEWQGNRAKALKEAVDEKRAELDAEALAQANGMKQEMAQAQQRGLSRERTRTS